MTTYVCSSMIPLAVNGISSPLSNHLKPATGSVDVPLPVLILSRSLTHSSAGRRFRPRYSAKRARTRPNQNPLCQAGFLFVFVVNNSVDNFIHRVIHCHAAVTAGSFQKVIHRRCTPECRAQPPRASRLIVLRTYAIIITDFGHVVKSLQRPATKYVIILS